MTDSVAAVETALAAEEFIAKIWQERRRFVREGRIKQPHPWQVALSQGSVSKAALIEYVKNRYDFLCNINRKDAQIIANCPIADARRLLLRKYIYGEGPEGAGCRLGSQYEMWLNVSDALEIPRGLMNSFENVLLVYRYTVDAVFNVATLHGWLEGVAATYASEGRMKRYTPKEEH